MEQTRLSEAFPPSPSLKPRFFNEVEASADSPFKSRFRRHRSSTKDVYACLAQVLCSMIGVLSVFFARLAVWLGQVNQLIVVGFVLALMAIAFESLVLQTALVHAGTRKQLTLYDFDALLRKDSFAPRTQFGYRLFLLLLFSLPLGLSVAYKNFIGGHSTILIKDGIVGTFGFTSTPGKQRIGDGISILTDIYVPFWIDPGVNRTYGFNLFVVDNSTAAVLDSPFPDYLSQLQSTLGVSETLTITSAVNATVSTMVNPTAEERKSDEYWQQILTDFGNDYSQNGGVDGANNALWAGMGGDLRTNFSVAFFSAWNTTKNETFQSEVIRVEQKRHIATGTWLITKSNITLTAASLGLSSQEQANQVLLQNHQLGLQELFSNLLGEFDWHNRAGSFDFPYPGPPGSSWRFFQPVNTVPALSASMAWARITSLDTNDRPVGIQNPVFRHLTTYTKTPDDIILMKQVPTLRRSYLLLLILAINPVLALLCIILKIGVWSHSPIRNEFTSISLIKLATQHSSHAEVRLKDMPAASEGSQQEEI